MVSIEISGGDADALGVGGDDVAAAVGGGDEEEGGARRVGDQLLLAVQHDPVAVGLRLHRVGARRPGRAGVDHRLGAARGPLGERAQPALLLLVGAALRRAPGRPRCWRRAARGRARSPSPRRARRGRRSRGPGRPTPRAAPARPSRAPPSPSSPARRCRRREPAISRIRSDLKREARKSRAVERIASCSSVRSKYKVVSP